MIPSRELDALVAEKVMGLSVNEKAEWLRDGRVVYWPDHTSCDEANIWLPAYSTDIAAAWEVVEELGGQISISKDDDQWCCEFDVAITFSVAKTAPHAICLAALKAVGVET